VGTSTPGRPSSTLSTPSPDHPLGADAPSRDFVGLAILGMACGVASGTAIIAIVLWVVRSLLVGAPASDSPNLDSAAAKILLFGTGAGMLFAATVCWRILNPLNSTYRQGGLSLVTAFAALVVSLVAVPVDLLMGRWGLLGLAALMGVAAFGLRRRARTALQNA